MIPVMNPLLPTADKYIHYLKRIDKNRYYSNRGPLVREFEELLSQQLGLDSRHELVVCANATIALEGFLSITNTSKWKVPAFTFAATVHAAMNSGVGFELVDIDPETWMIEISNNDDCHLVVLPFGAEFVSTKYQNIQTVLIDAAASIGNATSWINSIKPNWAAVFSLHATKAFGIGEGGAIVFGDTNLARAFRAWINFGFDGSRDAISPGTNGKMSELQAAVGLAVLEGWKEEESEWNSLREQADDVSRSLRLSPGAFDESNTSPYWIINSKNSEEISEIEFVFRKRGIETRRWWSNGCHKMPQFEKFFTNKYPHTDFAASTYLGIPYFRGMSKVQFEQIHSALEEAIQLGR